jgi:hypothetical protein
MVFIAITLADPAEPVNIHGWPERRRDTPDGPLYDYPATPTNIAAFLQRWGVAVASWRIIQYADIPTDRTYRDAWADSGPGAALGHDMAKVKVIAVQHVREDRIPALAELDKEWSRATGQKKSAEADAIETQRQILRDRPAVVTAAIANATTVEAVAAILATV